jgi:hypothetical protein
VEPMISYLLEEQPGQRDGDVLARGPPQTTRRPPGARQRTERSQVAGPTLSTTTSARTGQDSAAESWACHGPQLQGVAPAWPDPET